MFICGCRSFNHQHKEETKTNKNPYADRGLDRFSTLLADLDHKRQKIYAQMGSDDISFVQFVYSGDSKQVKPIVVKVKNKNKNFLRHSETGKSFDEIPLNRGNLVSEELVQRFGYCLGGITVAILVFLVIYGRFLAIIWATIGCYLVPMVVGRSRKVSGGPSCSHSGTINLQRYGMEGDGDRRMDPRVSFPISF